MNAFFATIAILLQSVLTMLGFAQRNPSLPPETQTQIVQTAQQAIQTATTQLNQGGSAQVPADCSTYASLKQGDTDQTTGGAVSRLQAFLGINPTTGYYGPQTGIGYTNKCVGGNAESGGVPGMSKYTDNDFGFSFWYPSSWSVISPAGDEPGMGGNLEDCTFKKSYSVHGNEISNGVSIAEYYCPNHSMTLRGADGANPVGMDFKYYFDANTHTWMVTDLSDPPNGSPRTTSAADISNNTMGGLHILAGAARFGANVVIPLSATNFLIVATNNGGGFVDERVFAKTIVATDPTVAIPVSTMQQIATIQAEASAYGVSTTNSVSLQTYTNTQYGFSVQYSAPFAPFASLDGSRVVDWWSLKTTPQLSLGIPNDYSNQVNVGASTDPTDVATCVDSTAHTVVSINGVPFQLHTMADPAAGQEGFSHTYSVVRDGVCYRISGGFVGAETSHMDTQTAINAEIASETAKFQSIDSIAQSFRFTQ